MNKPITGFPSIDKPWLKYYREGLSESPLPSCTMYEYLEQNNKDYSDDFALVYFGKKITYGGLFDGIDQTAKALQYIGVQDGDIVTILSSNTPETIMSVYALNRLGAIANMEYVTETVENTRAAIEKCKSKVVIVLDALMEKFSALAESPIIEHILVLPLSRSMPIFLRTLLQLQSKSKHDYSKAIYYSSLLAKAKDENLHIAKYAENTPAVILHSGGTTGIPKGVLLSNDNLNSVAWQNINFDVGYQRGETFMHSIPPFHAFGLGLGIHMPLCLGLCMILSPKFDEISIVKMFMKYKPNYAIFGCTHALHIAKYCDSDLSFLKMFAMGGASISKEDEESINDFLSKHNSKSHACIGYGLSETSSEICAELNKWYGKVGSVGIPFCKANVKILSIDTLEEQKYNKEGEICLSAPSLMLEYYQNKDETDKVIFFSSDGSRYLRTGDTGYMDEDGFLFITGRIKRIYSTRDVPGGTFFKLFPDYITSLIRNLTHVCDAAVVCIPNEDYRNIAIAYVVTNDDINENDIENEINSHLRSVVPDYCIPKHIVIVKSIPTTPIGKVDFKALENMAIAQFDEK